MKKAIFGFAVFVVSVLGIKAQAPSYTDFEWDILRVGYTLPMGNSQLEGGLSYGGELRFNLRDDFSIGLSSQAVTFDVKELLRNESGTVGSSYAIGFVGDYYFNTTSAYRSFIGAGVHLQSVGSFSFDQNGITEQVERASGSSIGARVGYEFGHVRLLANYNLGLKKELSNYISLSAALTLWGGYNG